MRPIITFARTFFKSLTSPAYYADVLKADLGFSIKYFVFFTLLTGLIAMAKVVIPVSLIDIPGLANEAIKAYPQDLAVSIKDGRLSINQPLPYVVRFPADWGGFKEGFNEGAGLNPEAALVVFDSDKNVQGVRDFLDYNTVFLITETTMYVRSDEERNEVKAYPFSEEMEDVSFTAAQVTELKNKFLEMPFIKQKLYVPLVAVIAFILFVPVLLVWRFMAVFLYSLGLLLVTAIFKNALFKDYPFSYTKVLQVSLHTITFAITIAYIADFFGYGHWTSGWWHFFIYLIWSVVVLMQATKLVPEKVVAPQPIKVTTKSKTTKRSK